MMTLSVIFPSFCRLDLFSFRALYLNVTFSHDSIVPLRILLPV
jgi:hypothetical protein